MSKTMTRPVSVLIAALGGEGGGVLTNWIVAAAQADGLAVQATSIPGVAQRTGATTYYVEIWPEPVVDDKQPILALSPAPGEIDIVATTELLETGRCIFNGFVTPDRTYLVASTHRVYTTLEKMVVGDGRVDSETILKASKERAAEALLMDLDALARSSGSRVNAVLLGVMAGSGKLPISETALSDAIREGGIAVEANLKGFQAGLTAREVDEVVDPAADISVLVTEAGKRLTAFQGKDYARLFQERMELFKDADETLRVEIAKGLTRRMAYEDIIRVAQLKTRPGRLRQLSGGSSDGEVVHITEFFRPGLREVCDILPVAIARRILAWAEVKPRRLMMSWPMTLRSTTVTGYLALSFLAKLRPLRRKSHRYALEQAGIDAWLADIALAFRSNPGLALEIASNARLIKGYGSTHTRGQAAFDRIQQEIVVPALQGQGGTADTVAVARDEALMDRPG